MGYSVATIKRMALKGELPYAIKFPGPTGGYLFDRDVVETFRRAS